MRTNLHPSLQQLQAFHFFRIQCSWWQLLAKQHDLDLGRKDRKIITWLLLNNHFWILGISYRVHFLMIYKFSNLPSGLLKRLILAHSMGRNKRPRTWKLADLLNLPFASDPKRQNTKAVSLGTVKRRYTTAMNHPGKVSSARRVTTRCFAVLKPHMEEQNKDIASFPHSFYRFLHSRCSKSSWSRSTPSLAKAFLQAKSTSVQTQKTSKYSSNYGV